MSELARQVKRFSNERCCWMASVRTDGRPHVVPVWHVWHAGQVFVVTKASSVKVRNIRENSSVSLSLEDPMEVFILEGKARITPDALNSIQPAFQRKYDWNIRTDGEYDTIIRIDPEKIWGWGGNGKFRWRAGSPLPEE